MCRRTPGHTLSLLLLLTAITACSAAYTAPIVRHGGVTFRILAPDARTISIVGSFNGWQRDRDRLSGPDERGWWSITLSLPPGRHEYLFLLDGREWLVDPHAQALVDDGWGGRNCLLLVGQ